MMARGSRNQREEEQEDSGPHMSDPMYVEEEGFEEDEEEPEGNTKTQEGKVALIPFVELCDQTGRGKMWWQLQIFVPSWFSWRKTI